MPLAKCICYSTFIIVLETKEEVTILVPNRSFPFKFYYNNHSSIYRKLN